MPTRIPNFVVCHDCIVLALLSGKLLPGPRRTEFIVVTVAAVGWRLTLEPLSATIGWSLLRRVDTQATDAGGAGSVELVGAGVLPAANSLRSVVADLTPASDTRGSPDPWACGLADPVKERSASVWLGSSLLPQSLRESLNAAALDARHTVTIATRGWLSAVPWDALALDDTGDVRLIERAQIRGGLSPSLFAHPAPRAPHSGRRLAVIDPGPIGGGDDPAPLYPVGYPEQFEQRIDEGRLDCLLPGWDPMSADDFGAVLRDPGGWGSVFYLGHIQRGEASQAAAAGLVFQRDGHKDLLTARSWIAEPDRWPAARRVCLIGCGSDDSLLVEQTGLPVAAFRAGAEFVASTRWTLPNDRRPGDAIGTTALAGAMLDAVDAEHPEAVMRTWQIDQLRRWRATGTAEASPLLWASLVSYRAPVRPHAPETDREQA